MFALFFLLCKHSDLQVHAKSRHPNGASWQPLLLRVSDQFRGSRFLLAQWASDMGSNLMYREAGLLFSHALKSSCSSRPAPLGRLFVAPNAPLLGVVRVRALHGVSMNDLAVTSAISVQEHRLAHLRLTEPQARPKKARMTWT